MRSKWLKITVVIVALLILFMIWYRNTYSMGVVDPREIGDAQHTERLLILTQGSAYKAGVVDAVIVHYMNAPVYIKVDDVTRAQDYDPAGWNAILVLHTWEMWDPQPQAAEFIRDADRSKLIVIATSGSGEEMIEGVDGISSASVLKDVPTDADKVIDRLHALMQ